MGKGYTGGSLSLKARAIIREACEPDSGEQPEPQERAFHF